MTSKTLRVLCYGDSLTSGYYGWGTGEHPYAQRLAQRLQTAFPYLDKLEVVPNGEPGELAATSTFLSRLEDALEKSTYDWVLILGGTNDLGSGATAEDTASALYEAWSIAVRNGCKVFAMTVPECKTKIRLLDTKRDMLNHMILTNEDRDYHSFDLRSKIPYHSLTDAEKVRYWDDGLHLTADGYDWMGDHIADALIPILKRELRLSQTRSFPPPPVRPPQTTKDDRPLEEEIGDPRDIRSGYVVVRRRDLD